MTRRDKAETIYLQKLGERIKSIRQQKGMSQVDLGYACEIEKQNMYRIEKGNTNPSILLLRKIAEKLDVDVSELLKF